MAADIYLYNKRGEAVLYQNADTLEADTPTQGQHEIFTHGIVEAKSIAPDFSGGDMAVSAASGKLWRAVTVQKPATLIPGNIKHGTDIAGVIGNYGEEVNIDPLDVNFYDYDGKILYAYTKSAFLALTALPDNPIHEGLTAQGWNWTLSEAQSYVSTYGSLEIGQTYITDNQKTRIYVSLDYGRIDPTLGLGVNGTVLVEWGDGRTSTLTGTSLNTLKTVKHYYTGEGDYVISLSATSGSFALSGYGSYAYLLSKGSTDASSAAYMTRITKVEIGANCSIKSRGLYGAYGMNSITLPRGITTIGAYALSYCSALKHITLPSGVTSIDTQAFNADTGLISISLPNTLTSINSQVFNACRLIRRITLPMYVTAINQSVLSNIQALTRITIPANVSTLGSSALSGLYALSEIRFKRSTPATAQSNTFSNLPTDCFIIVPSGSLSAYTSASNYPSSSTYTYLEVN